jgi:ligand-binding SRPBCC domain-containing protein
VTQDGGFAAGTTVRIEMAAGPIPLVWLARYESVVDGESFIDVQDRGPFASWRHEHRFVPAGAGCVMRDEVTFTLGRGLGLLDLLLVKPLLRLYFGMRHRALARWVREENPESNE